MSSVQPGIGPRGVCALCEGLAGEATARLIVQVGFEIGARDRAASGEAVVLAGPGRARRAQQALEASVAVAVAAVEEDGAPGVAGAELLAVDVVGELDLAIARVDLRRDPAAGGCFPLAGSPGAQR